ncbi:hypothetical protein [Zhongshania sp.]|uniref:hypothetical protein n=1 Tax=Zhongshania sp. TaxID=1971902 RepID=UPI0035635D37
MKFPLSMTRDYVRHWGVAQATREFIQNAIDSEAAFEWELEGDTFLVTSKGVELDRRTLLLGATSKADDPSSIGSFGEGYKIAMLVLCREGKEVKVYNGTREWTPMFQWSQDFNDDVLVVDEVEGSNDYGGLTFSVSGLTYSEIKQVQESCLFMHDPIPPDEVHDTCNGRILLNQKYAGCLYVNGLFVSTTQMAYGYDFEPHALKLERDRKTVSGWDLAWAVKDMWAHTNCWDYIADMIQRKVPDAQHFRYGCYRELRDKCHENLIQSHGADAVVATSQQELETYKSKGFSNVILTNDEFAEQVRAAVSYVEVAPDPDPKPAEVLREFYDNHKTMFDPTMCADFNKIIDIAENNWENA